ncbi:hypothetical protein ACQCLI_23215 [Pseudomonas nitroreducens]|uniref:hypothetical protein n=1 Tax=Pseudomonas TaxID=286 RepID=UPI000309B5AC|nr:hypothetical protein [Pseudomonas nitroreducens]
MRRLSALLSCLLLSTTAATALAGEPERLTTDPLMQDIERYLLLYSATGDERFLTRLDNLGTTFADKLAAQRNATALKDIWALYQQTLAKVRDAYNKKGGDLPTAVRQTREVAQLFDSFLEAGADTSSKLHIDLRELALLEARKANGKLLGESADEESQRILALQQDIQSQLEAMPAGNERDALLMRWTYLRKAEGPSGTLLYPFNAQIEYLTRYLPQS